MNDYCYTYEVLKSGPPMFPMIDCVYVIIMNNSKYEARVRDQLEKYPLGQRILLQKNAGFKRCSKSIARQDTIADLVDSNYTFLTNAIQNNYRRILVLEEDFIISPKLGDKDVMRDIQSFLTVHEPEALLLGSVLWRTGAMVENFKEVEIKLGAHAIIYNHVGIQKLYDLITRKMNTAIDIDILTNDYLKMYSYKLPLIIQVYGGTDNQKNWGAHIRDKKKRERSVKMYLWFLGTLGFSRKDKIWDAYDLNYKVHFDGKFVILQLILNFISYYSNKYGNK
jgi:hypothetical protein